MGKLMKRRIKIGSKGFSLVELIISLAILAVVGTAVGGAMYVSSRSYTRGSSEVNVQEEAQVASNLICDWLIDATEVNPDGSGGYLSGDYDYLVITHPEGDKKVKIEIRKVGGSLTYTAVDAVTGSDIGSGILATNVTGCNFHTTFGDDRNVRISIDFKLNDRTYHSITDSTSRSHDFISSGTGVTSGPPTVWVPDSTVILEPGQNGDASYSFEATVYGTDMASTTFTPAIGNTVSDGDVTIKVEAGSATNKFKITVWCTNTASNANFTNHNSGVFTLSAQNALGTGSNTFNVVIRRANRCSASVTEYEGDAATGGVYPEVTFDLGAENAAEVVGANFDSGVWGYKYVTDLKFYYRMQVSGGGWIDAKAAGYVDGPDDNFANHLPTVQVKALTTLPNDVYVIAVACHSGSLVSTQNIAGLGCRLGDVACTNKATAILGTNPVYTGGEPYIGWFILKKTGINVVGGAGGFKRGSQAFKVCEFKADIENSIKTAFPSTYSSMIYSVVIEYAPEDDPTNVRYYVVSNYDWSNFLAKKDHEAVIMRNTESTLFDLDKSYTINVKLYATNPSDPGTHYTIGDVETTVPRAIPYVADPGHSYMFRPDTYADINHCYTYHRGTSNDFYLYYSGFDNEYLYMGFQVEEGIDDDGDGKPDRWESYAGLKELQEKEKISSGVSGKFSDVTLPDGTHIALQAYNENAYPNTEVTARRVYLGANEDFVSGHYYRVVYDTRFKQYDYNPGVIGGANGTGGSMGTTYTENPYSLVGTYGDGSQFGYIYIKAA